MAAEGGHNIVWFTYTGREEIPDEATHVFVDIAVIAREAFEEHPNIVELVCHERVKKIEAAAFYNCPNLRRAIMPGVKIVGDEAFEDCRALTNVECGKLEIIKQGAFCGCNSLRSINNLPSVRIVEGLAFNDTALTDVKFGSKLERIDWGPFINCTSLERITIPLKDGLITEFAFQFCENLNHVDLVEGAVHETIAALQLEEWRDDMKREIDSINQILPNACAGNDDYRGDYEIYQYHGHPGEKARVIQLWIRSVIVRIYYYQVVHQRILYETAATLQFALPHDILMNSVIPFLALPEHTFELVNPRNGRR